MTEGSEPIDPAEAPSLFTEFWHTAWRLESRRRYAADELTRTYAQFARGEPVDWDGTDARWCAIRRGQTSLAKRVERVRIIDDPAAPGQVYRLENARRNITVGEAIRNLSRADAARMKVPAEDFWIFDSRRVVRLHFDDSDNLTDTELITDPAQVVRHCAIRDAATHLALPFQAFVPYVSYPPRKEQPS